MLRLLVNEPALAKSIAAQGRATVRARHTCAHRVDELMDVMAELDGPAAVAAAETGAAVTEASA